MMQIDIGRLNILTYRLCVYNSYTYVCNSHTHSYWKTYACRIWSVCISTVLYLCVAGIDTHWYSMIFRCECHGINSAWHCAGTSKTSPRASRQLLGLWSMLLQQLHAWSTQFLSWSVCTSYTWTASACIILSTDVTAWICHINIRARYVWFEKAGTFHRGLPKGSCGLPQENPK